MAFQDNDILKLAGAVLAAGVIDTNTNASWYEKRNANSFIIDPKSVWSDLPLMGDLHAANFAEAVQHANDNPNFFELVGINPDGSFDDDTAVRMTPVPGTNFSTYIAYRDFNDPQSGIIKNWIQPQLLPRPSGAASAAYQATIWIGKPSNGKRLLTTAGYDGNWVSHFWNPAGGLLLIAPDDAPPSATIDSQDLYITGFVYAGATGGGGGFSGSTILLEDPDGQWRIRNDYPTLRFERKETDNLGLSVWNSYGNIGHSVESDGLTLTRPYSIKVDLAGNLNDEVSPDYRSVFRLSGTDNEFIFGNSEQATVIETQKGTEIVRAAALREEVTIENRPFDDLVITLDSTDTAPPDSVKEWSWVSNIDYTQEVDYIRFNEILFDAIEIYDEDGILVDPDDYVPMRISVETLDGQLIQENVSIPGLNAGVDGNFNCKKGQHFYVIEPRYSDVRTAQTITRIRVADGYKVELKAGEYDYVDSGNVLQTQVVPYQKAKVEFLDHAAIIDESNLIRKTWENTGIVLSNGIHTYYDGWSDNLHQLVGVGEHTTANHPVLGNYEGSTYVATGSEGLFVLFQDDTTRQEMWTNGDRERISSNKTATSFIETKELTIYLDGIFTTEMDDLGWDIVNIESIMPLIRYEGDEKIPFRVSINSEILPDYRFQQNMTQFEFEDGRVIERHTIKPTIDADLPEYVPLQLPRQTFTVNRETPRRIIFQFADTVKVYGYYKDPTDPDDPVNTGTFVPSVKANVMRIFEEPIVTGDALEERIDSLEGASEWKEATTRNLPTLHVVPSLQVLADEDGEWLLWSDDISLFSSQDLHQWIFATGQEAHFELGVSETKAWDSTNKIAYFEDVVVHVPDDDVSGFEVSFTWDADLLNDYQVDYGVFVFYINSHGRGFDSRVQLNIPNNASVTWRFRQRRSGEYSYIATPMNNNLASVGLGTASNIPNIPEDPNPPVEIG
ncbi:hypothetical protein [Vibrio phage VCPH]|nr:hypothetical protein [Vibrio phage VCPH]